MRTLYDAIYPPGVDKTPATSSAVIIALLIDVESGHYTRAEAISRSELRGGAARQLGILIDDMIAATDATLYILTVQSALTWAERREAPTLGDRIAPRTPDEFSRRLKLR